MLIVERLLRCACMVETCSKCSALSGHVEVVKLLVSHSADVMCKDQRGYSPLHAASASGQLDVVKYLLRLVVEVKSLITIRKLKSKQIITPVMYFLYCLFWLQSISRFFVSHCLCVSRNQNVRKHPAQ